MNKWLVAILLSVSGVSAFASEQAVPDRYQSSCVACHGFGAAGAPKTGVAADWAPRMEKGMEAMLHSVNNGMGAMPPKGMCYDCTDDDYKALIEFMAAPKS